MNNPVLNKMFNILLILTCLTFLGFGAILLGPYFLQAPETANRCKSTVYDAIANQILLEKMAFIQKHPNTDVKFTDLPDLKDRIEAHLAQPIDLDISPQQFLIKLPECHTTVTYTWLHNQPLSLRYQSLQNQKRSVKTVTLKSPLRRKAER